jgi:Cu/Ag efflux protein CusF
MSKHLLRAAMALGIAAVAFTASVRAQDTNQPAAKPAKPARQQFTGTIESIDAKAETVIVKKGTTSKTFKIGEKTKYSTADKKEAAITDIKVGDKVKVAYTEENGVATAHKIGPPDAPKKAE